MPFIISNLNIVCMCECESEKNKRKQEREGEYACFQDGIKTKHFIVKMSFPLQPYCSLNLMCIRVTPFSHFFQVIVVFKYLVLFLFLFFFPIKPNANTHSSNNTITIQIKKQAITKMFIVYLFQSLFY